jgi:predicted amidophosphoribosyltransferase
MSAGIEDVCQLELSELEACQLGSTSHGCLLCPSCVSSGGGVRRHRWRGCWEGPMLRMLRAAKAKACFDSCRHGLM